MRETIYVQSNVSFRSTYGISSSMQSTHLGKRHTSRTKPTHSSHIRRRLALTARLFAWVRDCFDACFNNTSFSDENVLLQICHVQGQLRHVLVVANGNICFACHPGSKMESDGGQSPNNEQLSWRAVDVFRTKTYQVAVTAFASYRVTDAVRHCSSAKVLVVHIRPEAIILRNPAFRKTRARQRSCTDKEQQNGQNAVISLRYANTTSRSFRRSTCRSNQIAVTCKRASILRWMDILL